MSTLWYLPIERIASRYTEQLAERWFPDAFWSVAPVGWTMNTVPAVAPHNEIRIGSVLDGVGRGIASLRQMHSLMARFDEIQDGDAVYLQDFWTPGFEAFLYARDLAKKDVRVYAMCHAQSVDEYDFTHPMRRWMRPMEVGLASALSGMFVASTVHRDQLKAAGMDCPIHVVGLPFEEAEVQNRLFQYREGRRDRTVVFASRLDWEKNPFFMLQVAEKFLARNQDWEWVVSTGATEFRSNTPGVLEACLRLAMSNGRFKMQTCDGDKDAYYQLLARAAVQFNCSLQDYVSWTLLEATALGCDIAYPNFRSFPECVSPLRLYKAFDVDHAVFMVELAGFEGKRWPDIAKTCTLGAQAEAAIMCSHYTGPELNVWHQPPEHIKTVLLDKVGV